MPATPPVATPLPATRRTAIAALVLGSGALVGCDVDLSGSASRSRPAGPDAALVDRALAEIDDLASLARDVSSSFPRLRPQMSTWAALHDAHREALGGTDPTSTDSASASAGAGAGAATFASPEEAVATVRSREQRGQRRLADWAIAAESGSLARLLACMSAGVAQHLVPAPAEIPA